MPAVPGLRGSGRADREDRRGGRELRDERPRAPAAESRVEPRQSHPAERGRPKELERVGQADQCEETDRGLVDAAPRQPVGERRRGEEQRQAAREAHQQDREHAAVEVDRARIPQRQRARVRLHQGCAPAACARQHRAREVAADDARPDPRRQRGEVSRATREADDATAPCDARGRDRGET